MADKVVVKLVGSSARTEVDNVRTVREALAAARLSDAQGALTLNGSNTDPSAALRDGDFLLITPRVKGGASTIDVRVLRTGGSPKNLVLPAGSTVANAVQASGLDSSGCTPRLNGVEVDGGANLRDGDIITLVAKVHGGN